MSDWHDVEAGDLPPDGVVVDTRTTHPDNDGKLKRHGRLWFVPDGSMYVYYTPKYWRHIKEQPNA